MLAVINYTFLSDEQCWLHIVKSCSATFYFLTPLRPLGFNLAWWHPLFKCILHISKALILNTVLCWPHFVLAAASRGQLGRFAHHINDMQKPLHIGGHPDAYTTLCKLEKGPYPWSGHSPKPMQHPAWISASVISSARRACAKSITIHATLHWTAWD